MSQFNPAQGRTLIAVNQKDMARWLPSPAYGSGIVSEGGKYGMGDGYSKLYTPKDINQERVSLSRGEKEALSRLKELLTQSGANMDEISETELRAAAMALGGRFGDQVSLVGLHPSLDESFQDLLTNNPDYQGLRDGMRSTPSNSSHALEFLVKDGVLEPTGIQTGSDFVEVPPVDHLSQQKLDEAEDRIRGNWAKGHGLPDPNAPKVDKRQQVEQARGQAQHMDQQVAQEKSSLGKSVSKWFGNRFSRKPKTKGPNLDK